MNWRNTKTTSQNQKGTFSPDLHYISKPFQKSPIIPSQGTSTLSTYDQLFSSAQSIRDGPIWWFPFPLEFHLVSKVNIFYFLDNDCSGKNSESDCRDGTNYHHSCWYRCVPTLVWCFARISNSLKAVRSINLNYRAKETILFRPIKYGT